MIAADLFPIIRTLEELKSEAQARADRNAYPLAGLVPGEVREALSNITSLDRDEWAAAWSAIGDCYMANAESLPPGSAEARTGFMAAWRYYSFARWPVPIGAGKERAYRKALGAFLSAARSLEPPIEVVRIPFEGKEIVGYLRLPQDAPGRVPLILAIGGLDSRKEDMVERFSVLLPRGIGSFNFDMPGTGEAPVRIGPNAERMFSAALDYALARPEIDASKIIVYGGSFGGHWGVRLAVTERERLLGVITQSGPVHTAFQPEFLEKAFVTKEYLFDRGPAIASMYDGVDTSAQLLAAAPKNSLLTQGYLEKPMVEQMLVIGGEHDTQVPISDINLLLHSGTPKWSWINPNGGHMGREAKGWVDPVIFQKITVPWILQTLAVVLAFLIAAIPGALRAQTAPLHVPVILSLTGTAAFIGKGEQDDLRLIQDLINRKGGVNGRPVQFDIQDDASNTQTAVQLTNGILAQKPPVVLGSSLTQDCNAMAPLVRENGPVEWCFSPAIAPAPGGYIFSSSVSLRDCVVAQIRFFRERGLTRMAILSSTDATGQAFDNALAYAKSLPENRDVVYSAYEHFNLADVSVSAQIARIKAANPQALLTWTVGPAFGTELHGIADSGLDVPVGGSNGDMVRAQLAQYKGFMPKELVFPAVLASGGERLGSGPIRDAQSVYYNAFKAAGLKPDFPNTLAWDPALIVLEAYRKLGPKATAQQMQQYLGGLHGWVGINGVYDFRDRSQRGIGENAIIISRWDPAKEDYVTVSKRAGHAK